MAIGLVSALVLGALAACVGGGREGGGASGANSGGVRRDGAPDDDIDVSRIPDAVPRSEPVTRAGNKNPYVIYGKTYRLLPSSRGYREVGIASWYGTKFHGQNTAIGEPYSLYAMTAAHARLPIPCYVRVTNLENRRSIIVRVNDRGPFHDDRVIDLSYVAAKKLGYADRGTARVEVVAIDPADYQRNSVEVPRISNAPTVTAPASPPLASAAVGGNAYLQVGSFASALSAESLQRRLTTVLDYPVKVHPAQSGQRSLFKVVVGPVADTGRLDDLRRHLQQTQGIDPFVVRAPRALSN